MIQKLIWRKKNLKNEYAKNQYWNMFEEGKQKTKEYGQAHGKNMSEEDKQIKKKYMKEYKKNQSNNVLMCQRLSRKFY